MSPGSNTESYPAFAHIGLRENPGKKPQPGNLPRQDSNPGHLVSRPDALTVTPQSGYEKKYQREVAVPRIPWKNLLNQGISTTHQTMTADAYSSLMLAGKVFQTLGRAIVKEDEYEEVRWDGLWAEPLSAPLPPLSLSLSLFKKFLSSGERFGNDEDLKTSVTRWFHSQAAEFYDRGIQKLIPRYDKCLNSDGGYVEK
ncbi:hypothetical protein ANN_09608 [Periplaneta americana]|uniref:Uncharacterized protein n=1 Tax=Periplaneta americana TaxID=6978 RepID=A0ABQ8TNV7_PERAM|nr:hypothetical protein ANN_09608 [Periplaneta americana]